MNRFLFILIFALQAAAAFAPAGVFGRQDGSELVDFDDYAYIHDPLVEKQSRDSAQGGAGIFSAVREDDAPLPKAEEKKGDLGIASESGKYSKPNAGGKDSDEPIGTMTEPDETQIAPDVSLDYGDKLLGKWRDGVGQIVIVDGTNEFKSVTNSRATNLYRAQAMVKLGAQIRAVSKAEAISFLADLMWGKTDISEIPIVTADKIKEFDEKKRKGTEFFSDPDKEDKPKK